MNNVLIELRSFLNQHSDNTVIMYYNGAFSHTLMEDLLGTIRSYMLSECIEKKKMHNVFAVCVEQIQNILKYYDAMQEDTNLNMAKQSSILIEKEKQTEKYHVISGNLILKSDAIKLKSRLDRVCSMDKEALKKVYKDRMHAPILPNFKGAGMGILDMARKASEPIRFSFMDADESHAFYVLEVIL